MIDFHIIKTFNDKIISKINYDKLITRKMFVTIHVR